jgi:hypothetical protein
VKLMMGFRSLESVQHVAALPHDDEEEPSRAAQFQTTEDVLDVPDVI